MSWHGGLFRSICALYGRNILKPAPSRPTNTWPICLGQYKGVFRFSSQQKSRMGNRCKDDIEEFLLPNEVPPAESPTIFYRWRGRESGENVIQLRSEFQLYEMTFSNGGSKVSGTWGCDADPGDVQFTGVKVGEHNAYDRMNIQHEWGHLNKQTYDQENRDRWRRGY